MTALVVITSLLIDIALGEPKRLHPLVGFGFLAKYTEKYFNRHSQNQYILFIAGAISWLLIVIVPTIIIVVLAQTLSQKIGFNWWLDILILYLAIGYTSLRQHALAVLTPLLNNDINSARKQVSMIVSRDTNNLDGSGIRKATIESVLENGSDAIFAPLFWYAVGGVPAVIIYRLTNTLDAMWGYKTERFLFFGRFSARMDDILNWLPSRLVGISYSVFGHYQSAIKCWSQQAGLLDSPSAGVVMTSGAGALQLKLGGSSYYHGKLKQKPVFGCGQEPENEDIQRSLSMVSKTLCLWCAVIIIYEALKYWML